MSHGGFVIGSEMSRGVRNVLVKDCTFIDADVGLRFKSAMGRGGVVEDIYLENILMVGIKNESLIMTMDYVLNTVGGDDPIVQSTMIRKIFRSSGISSAGTASAATRTLIIRSGL